MSRSDKAQTLQFVGNKVLDLPKKRVETRFTATRSSADKDNDHSTPILANADALPEILTARELEAFLRIDVKTIYRYVQLGTMPYLRIESNVRFSKHQVLRWLEERNFRPRPVNGKGARTRQ